MNKYYNTNLRKALEPPDLDYYCPGLVQDVLSQNLQTGSQMREYCKDVACPKYCPSNYDCRDTCLEAPFTLPVERFSTTPHTKKHENRHYHMSYAMTFVFFVIFIVILYFILKN